MDEEEQPQPVSHSPELHASNSSYSSATSTTSSPPPLFPGDDQDGDVEPEYVNGEVGRPSAPQNFLSRLQQVANSIQLRNIDDHSEEDTVEEFDRTLPAEHTYFSQMLDVPGVSFLEPGWEGVLPCWVHNGVLFPGESVPMMCLDLQDLDALKTLIQKDRLFGLLFPDGSGSEIVDYGVICEVFQANRPQDDEDALMFKARARQRFKLLHAPVGRRVYKYKHIINCRIKVLPEIVIGDPLSRCRLQSLDHLRHAGDRKSDKRLRHADAAVTQWPLFVYDIFDVQRSRKIVKDYFRKFDYGFTLPSDIVSMSFWVATNLSLRPRDRLALFCMDNAELRMYTALQHISQKSRLCCSECKVQIGYLEHIFPMSSEGIHSNYCNPGGYVHDILTISKVSNVNLENRPPSLEFSWFPGYAWTIVTCGHCHCHVGWRFSATRKNLRPQEFWGLSRNQVVPQESLLQNILFDIDSNEI